MIPIGQRIKEARREKKLTQEELADNNISRSLISLIENGLSYPSMQTLEYLALKLDKHISYFLVENASVNSDFVDMINDLEFLLDTEEYEQIVNKAEGFIKYKLNSIVGVKEQSLGIFYCITGIALHKISDIRAYDFLITSINYLAAEDNSKYACDAYNCLALVMFKNKDYEQLEHYLNLADSCIKTITFENINRKLKILYNLSLSYYYQQKYSLAMDTLQEALSHSKKRELYYNFGEFNMLLALIYKNIDKIDDAIECNNKAIKYYKLTENKFMEHRCYINLSVLYRVCDDYYNSLNYINDAIIYFQSIGNEMKLINAKAEKLISMFILNKDKELILEMIESLILNPNCTDTAKGEMLTILAYLKVEKRDYASSLSLFKEAEALLLNNNDTEMNIFIYHGLSKVYEQLNDIENVAQYEAQLNKLLKERPYYEKFLYSKNNI
jgi:transcriptional regulator with XRE-family HTH domain/Tfp pilus assembly protein PilF